MFEVCEPEAAFAFADPNKPPELGAEEVVLADPNKPPVLAAEVVVLLPPPTPPKLQLEPPEVAGVVDPKPPPVAPDPPPNRGVPDAAGALPDGVVAGGVPALLALPLPRLNPEGLFPAAANGFGELVPLPGLLPNKPPPPPPVAAPNGFEDPAADVLPKRPPSPPAPEVAVPPNRLPPPDVLLGAVPPKILPLDAPLAPVPEPAPACPKLNFDIAPKASAEVFGPGLFPCSQSLHAFSCALCCASCARASS